MYAARALMGLGGYGLLAAIGTGFWLWALYDCYQNEPERDTWLWILMVGNVPAALAYFALRRLPYMETHHPLFVRRWLRRHELWQAESAAKNIGQAHQYVVLGDLKRELGFAASAVSAYRKCLEQEPENVRALWGLATLELRERRYADVRGYLEKLLKKDSAFEFGEAQLSYGRVLVELKRADEARMALESYLRQWNAPEARYLMARLLAEAGQPDEAQKHLRELNENVQGSPAFYYRKNRTWISRAKRLERSLKSPAKTA